MAASESAIALAIADTAADNPDPVPTQRSSLGRPPKLRASCDECGSAKTRCDRGQPCGRCQALNVECIYGISRKAGKRRKVPAPTPSSSADAAARTCNAGAPVAPMLSTTTTPTSPSGPNDLNAMEWTDTSTWNADADPFTFDFSLNDLCTAVPTTGTSPDGLFMPGPNSTLPLFTHQDRTSDLGKEGHDCFREAHSILGSLPAGISAVSDMQSGSTAIGSSPNDQIMPFDSVLSLSREAGRKLTTLTECSCAKLPHFALLYTSIMARILSWYSRTLGRAEDRPTPSRSQTSTSESTDEMDTCGGQASWPSDTDLPVLRTGIAVGSYDVDDLTVQKAVQVQLVAGELRRMGTLIRQFTSCVLLAPDSGFDEEDSVGAGGLYQSIGLWLRGRHAKLTSTARTILRELDI